MLLNFAVQIEGVGAADRAMWVLALDIEKDRVLVVHEDKSLVWHRIDSCKYAGMVDPAKPQAITVVQPSGKPTIYRPPDGVNLGGGPA